MSLALILFYNDMKPRSRADPAADPRNAAQKLRAVRRCHRKRWPPIEMAPMSSVTNLVKGMLREYIDQHGVAGLIPKRWENLIVISVIHIRPTVQVIR